jgi:hypothetical protein
MVFVCKDTYGQHVLNFVKFHDSKVSCILHIAECIATKTNIKHEMLSVSEKLEIIKKVDAQPHVPAQRLQNDLAYQCQRKVK